MKNESIIKFYFWELKFHCLTCSAMKMIHIFFCGNPNMICILSQSTFATVMDTLLGVNSGQLCGAANVCKFSSYCGKWRFDGKGGCLSYAFLFLLLFHFILEAVFLVTETQLKKHLKVVQEYKFLTF